MADKDKSDVADETAMGKEDVLRRELYMNKAE